MSYEVRNSIFDWKPTFWDTFASTTIEVLGVFGRLEYGVSCVAKAHETLFYFQGETPMTKALKVCAENGERMEDVIESDLQLSRAKAKELETMVGSDTEFSDEMTKVVATAKDMMLAKQVAENGKTVEQVKAVAKQKPKATDDVIENPQTLLKEKRRLERTIGQLQDRLVQVEETLRSMQDE